AEPWAPGADTEWAHHAADLGLYDPGVGELTTERKIDMARSAEEAARGADPRIANSEGSACSTAVRNTILVTSAGFAGEYQSTTCALTVAPTAKEGGQMQVAARGDRQGEVAARDSPETLERGAAQGTLRKLNARKVTTREAPVVFESSGAEELLDDFFVAVDGYSIFWRASFLVGRLGGTIAPPGLAGIDGRRLRSRFGSRPLRRERLAS